MAFQQRNPSVPFTYPILGSLCEGKGLKIKGHIQDHAQRFYINLVCANGDVVFHFNPRFDEGPVVVCNTMENGCWGTEERAPDMPFQRDASFKTTVVVRSHCYQVFVNHKCFLEYRHRLPVHHIHALEIRGDIDLKKVTLKDIKVSDVNMELINLTKDCQLFLNRLVEFDGLHRLPLGQMCQLETVGDVTFSRVTY